MSNRFTVEIQYENTEYGTYYGVVIERYNSTWNESIHIKMNGIIDHINTNINVFKSIVQTINKYSKDEYTYEISSNNLELANYLQEKFHNVYYTKYTQFGKELVIELYKSHTDYVATKELLSVLHNTGDISFTAVVIAKEMAYRFYHLDIVETKIEKCEVTDQDNPEILPCYMYKIDGLVDNVRLFSPRVKQEVDYLMENIFPRRLLWKEN